MDWVSMIKGQGSLRRAGDAVQGETDADKKAIDREEVMRGEHLK